METSRFKKVKELIYGNQYSEEDNSNLIYPVVLAEVLRECEVMQAIHQQKQLRNRRLTRRKTPNLSKKLADRISRSFLIPEEELITLEMHP